MRRSRRHSNHRAKSAAFIPSSPSFKGLIATSEAATRFGRGNRARDTRPELLLRKALWKRAVRYRVNYARLPGKPDIALVRQRVAIFCDGDFWHGRRWAERRKKLARGANARYWIPKLEKNIQRDRAITHLLRRLGWKVVRVWESDVIRDPGTIACRIASLALEASRTK